MVGVALPPLVEGGVVGGVLEVAGEVAGAAGVELVVDDEPEADACAGDDEEDPRADGADREVR